MLAHLRIPAGLFVSFLLIAASASAQDTRIAGARFTVIEKNEDVLAVTIENLRDSPLVAWEIGVLPPGDRMAAAIHSAEFAPAAKYGPESGPVPPHARRLINIPIDGRPAGWTAVVNRVVFADGHREAGSDVRSIHVTFVPAAIGKPYAVVENLRNVPIEALMFVGYGRHDDRNGSRFTTDFCGAIDFEPGRGRIGPGETREFPLSWVSSADGTRPTVELGLVMFDDLTFEGSAAARESVLRDRDRRADNLAYWIAALTDAATQTPERAHEFLEARKRERVASGSRGDADTTYVDQVLDRIKRSPAELASVVRDITSLIELQRAQFARHQSR